MVFFSFGRPQGGGSVCLNAGLRNGTETTADPIDMIGGHMHLKRTPRCFNYLINYAVSYLLQSYDPLFRASLVMISQVAAS